MDSQVFFVKLLLKGYNVSIFNSPFVTPGVAVTKDMFCCLLVYSMAAWLLHWRKGLPQAPNVYVAEFLHQTPFLTQS